MAPRPTSHLHWLGIEFLALQSWLQLGGVCLVFQASMKKNSSKLSPKRIIGHRLYEFADFSTYTLLVETLLSEKFLIYAPVAGYARSFPNFDKVFWRTHQNFFTEGVTRDLRIPAGMIVHQGVHSIFSIRFLKKATTDVALILLAEAMATAINFYFLVLLAKTQNLDKKEITHGFRLQKHRPWIKMKFLVAYEEFDQSPVRFFYETSADILRIYEFMLGRGMAQSRNPADLYARWMKLLKALKHPWLARAFELENNVLYVSAVSDRSRLPTALKSAKLKLAKLFADTNYVDEVLCNVGTQI
jgi:hypothetical protein